VWDVDEKYTNIHTLRSHSNAVISMIKLSYNSIASFSDDKTIKIWDFENSFENDNYTLQGNSKSVPPIIELKNENIELS